MTKRGNGGQRASIDLQRWFGQNLKRYRIERGMRQSELAELVGMSRTNICNMEAGRIEYLGTIAMCADALGITPSSLFNEPDKVQLEMQRDWESR